MRILGIDCGCDRTGYGVIDSDGARHRLVDAGEICPRPGRLERRLLEIALGLKDVIGRLQPDAAAVEEVFYSANVKTALRLAHVRGAAMLAGAEAGLEVGEYSALEVKTSVVGYGRAHKAQVQVMVRSLLAAAAPALDSENACDALAVAICHATRRSASAPA
ncbi:MAG: crossover junction endodeoxyribonuclease RuvC [Acidobacteria bacterium]|nr:crossover junction endodeoxyribonuclease RuvC [Acidobacteriota bacterium]